MPRTINFFTPKVYRGASTFKTRMIQKVDNYFYLGGKKAYVLGVGKGAIEKIVFSKSYVSRLEIAGKTITYATLIIPLIMLGIKAILRIKHPSYKIIDPRKKLEKGLNLSNEIIQKINSLWPIILNEENHSEIEWMSKGENDLVFRLKNDPKIVYKFSKHGTNPLYYANIVKAKTVCLANQLGLLVIPSSQLIQIGNNKIIAEACVDINFESTAQEELYHKYSSDLNQTVKQLALFVAKTGFSNVTWKKIPILNEAEDFQGKRRIALIGLKQMNSPIHGFVGDPNGNIGLIGCMSKDQISIVIDQGRKKSNLRNKDASKAKKKRLIVLKADEDLRTFYEKKGIKSGKELIQLDINSLGLNLNEISEPQKFLNKEQTKIQKKSVYDTRVLTLKEVTEAVIAEINRLIENSNEFASIKAKRSIIISTHEEPFIIYERLGNNPSWMNQIINALIEKQHIYQLEKVNPLGFYIQA